MDGDAGNLFRKLESKSIIPSKDLLIEKVVEPQFKYILDNLLSEVDVTALDTTDNDDELNLVQTRDALKEYIEKTKETKFVERYSSFSLIPDIQEAAKVPYEVSRLGALENILSEEKIRIANQSEMNLNKAIDLRRFSSTDYNKNQEPSKEMITFMRIHQKLEKLKEYCPKLYHTDTDIITVWGNMVKNDETSLSYANL